MISFICHAVATLWRIRKHLLFSGLLIVGITSSSANAMKLPLLNPEGQALAMAQGYSLVVYQEAERPIFLQFDHLDKSSQPSKEIDFKNFNCNCVQILCGKQSPKRLEMIEIYKKIREFALYQKQNPKWAFFEEQLALLSMAFFSIEQRPLTLLDQNKAPVILSGSTEKTVSLKFSGDSFKKQRDHIFGKVVLQCAGQPATAKEQEEITLVVNKMFEEYKQKFKNLSETEIFDQLYEEKNPLLVFYKQLLIMNTNPTTQELKHTIYNTQTMKDERENAGVSEKTRENSIIESQVSSGINQQQEPNLMFRFTQLNPQSQETGGKDYNCLRVRFDNKPLTKEQFLQIYDDMQKILIYIPNQIPFFNQMSLIRVMMSEPIKKEASMPLLNLDGKTVLLKNKKPVNLMFYCEGNQEITEQCYSKVVLMCGNTPAMKEQIKEIMMLIENKFLETLVTKKSQAINVPTRNMLCFYLQIALFCPCDKIAWQTSCKLTTQEEIMRLQSLLTPKPESITLTTFEKPHDFQANDYAETVVNYVELPDYMINPNGPEKLKTFELPFETIREQQNLSLYELSRYKVGDIIFTNDKINWRKNLKDAQIILNEFQYRVQQFKTPTQEGFWTTDQEINIATQDFCIFIDACNDDLLEQLNNLPNAAKIKQNFNNGQAQSFLIGLKYKIRLWFKVEKGPGKKIIISTACTYDNLNITQNPVIGDLCAFYLLNKK